MTKHKKRYVCDICQEEFEGEPEVCSCCGAEVCEDHYGFSEKTDDIICTNCLEDEGYAMEMEEDDDLDDDLEHSD